PRAITPIELAMSEENDSEPSAPAHLVLPITPLPLSSEEFMQGAWKLGELPEALQASMPLTSLLLSDQAQPVRRRAISRRKVLVGLTGLALTAGSLSWFLASQRSSPTLQPRSRPVGLPTTAPTAHPSLQQPSAIQPPRNMPYLYHHSGAVFAVAWSPDG